MREVPHELIEQLTETQAANQLQSRSNTSNHQRSVWIFYISQGDVIAYLLLGVRSSGGNGRRPRYVCSGYASL